MCNSVLFFVCLFFFNTQSHVIQTARGEQIELLVEKTAELEVQAVDFKKVSGDLKKHMWWKNVKLWIIIICVVLVRKRRSSARLPRLQNSHISVALAGCRIPHILVLVWH